MVILWVSYGASSRIARKYPDNGGELEWSGLNEGKKWVVW